MTELRRPDNGQLCTFVSNREGWVQLRTFDTVTSMTRWYATAAVQACNPDVNLATLKAVDPRLTGMVYGCAIPQNFASGLNYIYPLPYVQPLILALPADMLGTVGGGRGKNKRATVPGVNAAESLHVIVIKPVTLFSEWMKVA